MTDGVRLVLSTLPGPEPAWALVRTLLEERLVACGNILPGMASLYWWRGEIEESDEVLVLLKTTEALLPRLLERGPELHPYDVPEFVVVTVPGGHPPYLEWVRDATRGGS